MKRKKLSEEIKNKLIPVFVSVDDDSDDDSEFDGVFKLTNFNCTTLKRFQNEAYNIVKKWEKIKFKKLAQKAINALNIGENNIVIFESDTSYSNFLHQQLDKTHTFDDFTVPLNKTVSILYGDKYEDSKNKQYDIYNTCKFCPFQMPWLDIFKKQQEFLIKKELFDAEIATKCPENCILGDCCTVTAEINEFDKGEWDEMDAGDSYSKSFPLYAKMWIGVPNRYILKDE